MTKKRFTLIQKLRKENDYLRDEISFHYKPMLSLLMALVNAPRAMKERIGRVWTKKAKKAKR